MVGISHLQQLYLNTNWLNLIIMRKPNGESHTYACVAERQLSGKQFFNLVYPQTTLSSHKKIKASRLQHPQS
jgi:cell division protein FtsL